MKDLYAEKTIEKAPKEKGGKKATRQFRNAYKVLERPVITEKAANLGENNKYVFAVSMEANKVEIAKAIMEVYGIKPTSVNIVQMHGKKVRTKRLYGKRKDWKKAIITLPEGKSIKVYEGV